MVMDYRGLSVKQLSELRREFRKAGSELVVIKNTLFRMAAKETGTVVDEEILNGPTAVAFSYDDPVATAKVLADFVKKHPTVIVKGGGAENEALSADQVKALAKIPSRPVLLSQFAGALQAPMSTMASGLNALNTKFAQLLQALAEKQEAAA
jgi:large subunit ribosomal protein L10